MNAPTLLVGLGGTGSKVICNVAELVSEEQRKRIEFVAIDTDINELGEVVRNYPFVRTIQISSRMTVGEYLEINKHARDTWFPVNKMLNSKVVSEGAGQVRAISRLAFETAVRESKLQPLQEAIDSLYKVEYTKQTQALRVIIVSSLAGGTGSGIILPAGLYIKNYISTHFRHSATITRGFFLLPELFFGPITAEGSRNNLRSNAYAALRELDAFLMRADGTVAKKYADSVRLDFPRPDSDDFEDYYVRPYDFCFLYDAQNSDGSKFSPLSLGEYIRHAASCIYAQSIGPMNARSNSSEDNTIRRLSADQGRSRYAGAGSSMLIYPINDIKKYLGLSWTRKMVTESWLTYDNQFREQCIKADEKRESGVYVKDPVLESFYPMRVEKRASANDPMSKSIINACVERGDDGVSIAGEKWNIYVDALLQKIESDESDAAQPVVGAYKQMASLTVAGIDGSKNSVLSGGDNAWGDFPNAYQQMKTYRAVAEKHVDDTAAETADALFWAPSENILASQENFNLVKHLKDPDGKFMHPCAIRYMLYKIKQALIERKHMLDARVSGKEGYMSFMRDFDDVFDDKSTDEREGVESLTSRKLKGFEKFSKNLNGDQMAMKNQFSIYITRVDEYRVDAIQLKVVEEAINYVTALSDAYTAFFNQLSVRVSRIGLDMNAIMKKYENAEGRSVRYVCVSPKCLNEMLSRFGATGSGMSIDQELSENIYSRVFQFAMNRKKPDVGSYFNDVFDTGIVGYYTAAVSNKHGSSALDVDIIDAIINEAKYEHGIAENSPEIGQYLIRVIESARNLSVPFIEKPLGVEKEPIFACTYGEAVTPDVDDSSMRANIIREHLETLGGKADESLGRKECPAENDRILFYQAIYGLRANELSKFSPPMETPTIKRDGGEYYKAYFNLVSKLSPNSDDSRAITPHIDRWWHIISKLPDLDDGNQAKQEERIDAAFFWALLALYIRYNSSAADKMQYNLDAEMLGMDSSRCELIVSNGTSCDRLYEVLDALTIYPELVERILRSIDDQIEEDKQNTAIDPLGEGFFSTMLESFTIGQFKLKDNASRSVFELPLLICRSIKGENQSSIEDDSIHVLRATLSEIKKYVAGVSRESEAVEITGKIIEQQFELFLANVELEKDEYRDIYHNNFFIRICSAITRFVKELGLSALSTKMNAKVIALTK